MPEGRSIFPSSDKKIHMPHRPMGEVADLGHGDFHRLFQVHRLVGGHRHGLQQFQVGGLFQQFLVGQSLLGSNLGRWRRLPVGGRLRVPDENREEMKGNGFPGFRVAEPEFPFPIAVL